MAQTRQMPRSVNAQELQKGLMAGFVARLGLLYAPHPPKGATPRRPCCLPGAPEPPRILEGGSCFVTSASPWSQSA